MNKPVKNVLLAVLVVVICSGALVALAYRLATSPPSQAAPTTPVATHRNTPTDTPTPTPTASPTPSPTRDPSTVLGIESPGNTPYKGITWERIGYQSCGAKANTGTKLKGEVENFHQQGVHILLTVCQPSSGPPRLYDTNMLQDAASVGADAVQCGNEQMKQDAMTLYVPPANFARFYNLCEQAVHRYDPGAKIILGSMDPLVMPNDYYKLEVQVGYLNEMQAVTNSSIHPGGTWNWRNETLGLIDSWHNGYPGDYVNNLNGLFSFWARQFNVDLNSGGLGKHLWVVEGTGCFKGCNLNVYNPAEIAIAHIFSLTSDVQTAMQYRVPFFYFSGRDFILDGELWPIGVLDPAGHNKPLRQDLGMGAVTLTMSCSSGQVTVKTQIDLLGRMYQHCKLPGNYRAILGG